MTPPGWRFPVRVPVPDLRPHLAGNVLPGVWSFAADAPGPHVAISALVHGNEIAGAAVLARWLEAAMRPLRGRLTLLLCNLDAFARFDALDPTLSRYVDEDLNRVWDAAVLDGPRTSRELRRARALRPVLDDADVLLDLHSMLWPSDPLLIAGPPAKVRPLALALGTPPLVVADQGHAEGLRMIDYGCFADPASPRVALLVEGGPHWEAETPALLEACGAALLRETGLIAPSAEGGAPGGGVPVAATPASATPPGAAPSPGISATGAPPDGAPVTSGLWEVTRTVTARSRAFGFVRPFRGGAVIPARNTLIALDGDAELRTPHDDCLLVMPSPQVLRGHTAVRLARRVGGVSR